MAFRFLKIRSGCRSRHHGRNNGGYSRRLYGGFPCRHRRGLSALAATLLVSLALATGFAGFAQSEALRLRDAQATRLERWARQEARALHLWLHETQGKSGFLLPAAGSARQVGNSGNPPDGLDAYRAPGAAAPRGFRARHVVANSQVQANNPHNDPALQRAHGILVIHADTAITGNERYLLTVLCQALSPSAISTDRAEALADQALGGVDFGGAGCDVHNRNAGTDPGRAIAVFAAPLSGIDKDLVLRAPRAGFAPTVMEAELDMGGHDITGIGTMTTRPDGDIKAPVVGARTEGPAVAVTGNLTVEGDFGASHLRAGSGEVVGHIDVTGRVMAVGQADSRLDVTGSLGNRNHTVNLMTLSGPGPITGVRTLSVHRCSPSANCRGTR